MFPVLSEEKKVMLMKDGENLSLLWIDCPDKDQKISHLNEMASESYCYLRLLILFPDFSKLPLLEFQELVKDVAVDLGPKPLGTEVLPSILIQYSKKFCEGCVEDFDTAFTAIYTRNSHAGVRVKLTVENKMCHVEPLNLHQFCECEGPVCCHGYDLRFVATAITLHNRRVGASNFDPNDLIDTFEETAGFGKAMSALEPRQRHVEELKAASRAFVKRSDERNGTSLSVDLDEPRMRVAKEEFVRPKAKIFKMEPISEVSAHLPTFQQSNSTTQMSPPPPPPPPPMAPQKCRYVAEGDSLETSNLRGTQTQLTAHNLELLTPPTSPVAPSRAKTMSLLPDDSSSTLERYESNRRFMKQGTVFSPASLEESRVIRKEDLSVENYLVNGYYQDKELREAEEEAVLRLRPINGLPTPFTNKRLNFLANISTAIGRSQRKYSGTVMHSTLRSMNSRARNPHDNLLLQVLHVTLDLDTMRVVSNLFRLPYLEIGMQVSEDSMVKCFDLLEDEYKTLWFSQLKDISVPVFHSRYEGCSTDPLTNERNRKQKQATQETNIRSSRSARKQSNAGSILSVFKN